ncbi:MAG: hypothetical protein IIB00_05830 [candidate division Zixibacteria bacterium]|nr:hypothetical protein [candidate division Zixibacteria bacterium]
MVFRRVTFLIVIICALSHSWVSAQPDDSPERKRPEEAVSISLWSTVFPTLLGTGLFLTGELSDPDKQFIKIVGAGLVIAGVSFGPSTGHSYARQFNRAALGVGLRLATSLSAIYVVAYSSNNTANNTTYDPTSKIIAATLGAFAVTSAIYDIAAAGRSADTYNQKHGFTKLQLTPVYFSQTGAIGLKIGVGI